MKIIVQKEYDLHSKDLIASQSYPSQNNDLYARNLNYLITPEKITPNKNPFEEEITLKEKDQTSIKELIINQEYFNAAKKIISLKEKELTLEFDNLDDYFYWSSFVYYNLGNSEEAMLNIEKISNLNGPKMFFLKALIIKTHNPEEAEIILKTIIDKYPSSDYAQYASAILIDG